MSQQMPLISVASDDLPHHPTQALGHLPGPAGHWLTGNLRQLAADPRPRLQQLRGQYGDCFTFGFLRNRRVLIMAGLQACELVLADRAHNFSSRWGWEVVHAFFGRNILVRDFEDHRMHRKLMTRLFKSDALAAYLQQMRAPISGTIDAFNGEVDVYRQTKVMALDIAMRVFAGLNADDVAPWNRDLNIVLSNVMAHRIRLPGTRYSAALNARNRLRRRLRHEISTRRGNHATDLFSQLINQRDDQGRMLGDEDIVDHMFGLLFAAHDTTASSLAMMFWLLARHPHLQQRARDECLRLHATTGSSQLCFEDQQKLPFIEAFFKETLRMYAPIQLLPRRSVREFSFQGHDIPANTVILLAPQLTHFDPALYPEPEQFDPDRFLAQSQPSFAFIPFGKGSHMCLGMHFAHLEIKAVLYQLLLKRQLSMKNDASLNLEYLPIVRPEQSMQVTFTRLPNEN